MNKANSSEGNGSSSITPVIVPPSFEQPTDSSNINTFTTTTLATTFESPSSRAIVPLLNKTSVTICWSEQEISPVRVITVNTNDQGVAAITFSSKNGSYTDLVDVDNKWTSKGLIVNRPIDTHWQEILLLSKGNYYFKSRTSNRLKIKIIVK